MILEESADAKALCERFEQFDFLNNASKKTLCRIVISYFSDRNIILTCSKMKELANEIGNKFNLESVSFFFFFLIYLKMNNMYVTRAI